MQNSIRERRSSLVSLYFLSYLIHEMTINDESSNLIKGKNSTTIYDSLYFDEGRMNSLKKDFRDENVIDIDYI